MHAALEHCFLALKLFCMIILRESNVNVKVLFSLLADDLLFKAGNECSASDGKRMILTLAAFERNAVYRAFIVKYYLITFLYFAIYAYHSGLSLKLLFDLVFDILIGNLCLKLLDLKALIFLKCCLGIKGNLCGKYERLANFKGNHIYLGSGNYLFFTLIISFLPCFRDNDICCIPIEEILTVHFLYDNTAYLTAAETGYIYLVLILLVGSLQCILKVLISYFHCKDGHIVFQLFQLYAHYDLSS